MKKQLVILFFFLSIFGFSQKNNDSILAENREFRDDSNEHYADSAHSPLTEEARKEFDSIPFFPIDTTYYVSENLLGSMRSKSNELSPLILHFKVFGRLLCVALCICLLVFRAVTSETIW